MLLRTRRQRRGEWLHAWPPGGTGEGVRQSRMCARKHTLNTARCRDQTYQDHVCAHPHCLIHRSRTSRELRLAGGVLAPLGRRWRLQLAWGTWGAAVEVAQGRVNAEMRGLVQGRAVLRWVKVKHGAQGQVGFQG